MSRYKRGALNDPLFGKLLLSFQWPDFDGLFFQRQHLYLTYILWLVWGVELFVRHTGRLLSRAAADIQRIINQWCKTNMASGFDIVWWLQLHFGITIRRLHKFFHYTLYFIHMITIWWWWWFWSMIVRSMIMHEHPWSYSMKYWY